MTSPFDYRRDVEIPEDLLKRICQGQRESKDAVQFFDDRIKILVTN